MIRSEDFHTFDILHLAYNLDSSTLILESLNHQLRRGGGNYNGGWNTHFPGYVGCSHTCITTWKNEHIVLYYSPKLIHNCAY